VLQVREYGEKVGSVLRETTDRGALLQTVASTREVLPGVPYRDFQAVIERTDVDSQFLQAVSAAKLTEPQVRYRCLKPTDELFCQPTFNLRDGPAAARLKYISG